MVLSPEILKLQRDRLVLAQFRRKFHADMAAFAFRLALLRASLTQKELQHRAGFNPAQARDPNGRWTAGGGSDQDQQNSPSDRTPAPYQRVTDVINICMLEGFGSTTSGKITSYFGYYRCRDGKTFRRQQWTPKFLPFLSQP